MEEAGIEEPLRFTAPSRTANRSMPTAGPATGGRRRLYFRERDGNLLVVSEPIDDRAQDWREVPKGCCLVARRGAPPSVECLDEAMGRLAA